MLRRSGWSAVVVVMVAAAGVAMVAQSPPVPAIPLCPGLTIVTAVNQRDGDYESIKTIEAVTPTEVRLKYSVERLVEDMMFNTPPKQVKATLLRTFRRADLQTATLYEQQFSDQLPELIPETTAVGTSTAVLNALKSNGESKLGIFIAYSQIKPPIDRNTHPNVYDNQMVATVTRVESAPVMVPVIVNDVPVSLPAIHAAGDFFGDKTEFYFLDDPANPLTLKFRFGIGYVKPLSPEDRKACDEARKAARGGAVNSNCDYPDGRDRDTLRVIKISYHCAAPPPVESGGAGGAGGGAGPAGAGAAGAGAAAAVAGAPSALEKELTDTGKADVYSIFFSFNSDVIREESEPTLKEIADVLGRHPTWRLGVNGHTDGIGADQPNLDLSRRRSAAVKDALVKRYGIDAARLVTNGFGRAQPKDTNDTLEGRSHNRRVELIRQ